MDDLRPFTVPFLNRYRYPAVGFCIYCGATDDLNDEHIIPFGLGGNLVLPRSTCANCSKVTSRFERTVLRGPLRPVRLFRGIQSRRKHRDAPTLLPLKVRYQDDWELIKLPHDEYPLILHFFVYDVPGYLDPENYRHSVRVRGQLTYSFGLRPEQVLARLGAKEIQISQTYVPTEFAKMTTKVAFSMAVAIGVLDLSRGRPEIIKSILGHTDDIGRWVGTITEPRQWIANVLHHVGIERDHDNGVLTGRVQYFTDSGTPVYGVILGSLDDAFVRSPS